MTKRVTFKVSFVLPPGATVARAKDYIDEWVRCGRGACKPPGADEEDPDGDAMFDLDADTVRVVRIL